MYIEFYSPQISQSDLCNFSQQPCELDLIIPALPKKKPVIRLKSGRATSQKQVCVTSGPVRFPFHLSTGTNAALGLQYIGQSEDMSFVAQDQETLLELWDNLGLRPSGGKVFLSQSWQLRKGLMKSSPDI